MARDFKISNFTFTTATAGSGILAVTPNTPTGDVANSGANLGLVVTAGTATGSTSDTKQVMGFRNSRIDTAGTLANFLAGNEISAIANDPALPGSTSYGELYMTFNLSWSYHPTAASNLVKNGGFFVVEGAYDNGTGAVDSSSFTPISGPVPLVIPAANLAAVAIASNTLTTVAPHNLKPGDNVVIYNVTNLAGAGAPLSEQMMVVFSVPSPTQFTLAAIGSASVAVITGTPAAGATVYRVNGASIGGHRAAAPIVPSRRSYYRLALRYTTNALVGPSLNVSRVGLTVGRDNASVY